MRSRSEEYLIVDGYNIINAWDKLKNLSNVSLDTARNELVDIMAEYQAYTGINVIIVFDAYQVKGSSFKEEVIKGVKVVYTKEKETADHYIEKTLDALGKRKKIMVATSDWIEQQIVLGRGGTRMSARELELEINSIKRNIRRSRNKEKETNDMLIGRLDPKLIEKLEKWRKGQ